MLPVKPIRFSGHARFEMKRRGIKLRHAIGVIRKPGQVLPSVKGRHIYQDFVGPKRRFLLRVIVYWNAMKVIYDKETDTLAIIFRSGKVAESDEPRPGMILDYDKAGKLVSIELLDASEQVQAPQTLEFALAGQ